MTTVGTRSSAVSFTGSRTEDVRVHPRPTSVLESLWKDSGRARARDGFTEGSVSE